MPLLDGYGVLAGTLAAASCDARRSGGRYYHCTLRVNARGRRYLCAVDLDSKHDPEGIAWRVVRLDGPLAARLGRLRPGWHWIPAAEGSGALDYFRSPELQSPVPWKHGTGVEAFADLEPLLRECRSIFVFGEPFRGGGGVHNIHQNQGDPPSSRWAAENGPWQDGCVVVGMHDGRFAAFLCRFRGQSRGADAVHAPTGVPVG